MADRSCLGNSGILSLPNEILLHIISLTCDSQSNFRSLLLIDKRFYTLVQFDRLPHIPIRLNTNSVRSFSEFIALHELAASVRYLWINGTSSLCSDVVNSCNNLVSLACSKTVLYSLCCSTSIKHTDLTELTLFDNWRCWHYMVHHTDRRGIELCQQITHLRIHEPVSDDFSAELFPSLTHFSYSAKQITAASIIGQLAPIYHLPKINLIVITTFFWADEPADERTRLMLSFDKRIRIVYFGSGEPVEFALWCGRARQMETIWTRHARIRRLVGL
ncbi:hypothetical protein GALMADRAFT_237632 [Galerina marginata CBS 339.88]|uniref:F-box domain-containing protein n=1 Tax=Galerina marginata (strain CBS 339.88) TaxID=685588 RepID=A0A067TGL7_GALM3|nr:hypothetical protein GALMADRAFT_237632 [Galerina marginata CBS 339.88]